MHEEQAVNYVTSNCDRVLGLESAAFSSKYSRLNGLLDVDKNAVQIITASSCLCATGLKKTQQLNPWFRKTDTKLDYFAVKQYRFQQKQLTVLTPPDYISVEYVDGKRFSCITHLILLQAGGVQKVRWSLRNSSLALLSFDCKIIWYRFGRSVFAVIRKAKPR